MNYIGSKSKLNNWIFQYVDKLIKPGQVFLDACSGSGAVSQYAARKYTVIANDNMFFPSCIVKGSIGTEDLLDELYHHIDVINSLSGQEGLFYKEYSPKADRLYFTEENAALIDDCRFYIENVSNPRIKNVLIYFGLDALSKVSNTAGTHGAFLKHYQERAKFKFKFKLCPIVPGCASAYHADVLDLLNKENIKYNLMYLDPPYNTRKYAPNYHLYETFARYDNPKLKGKTGLRANWKEEADSNFCKKNLANQFFNDVFNACKAPYLLISYSSDGLLKVEEMEEILKNNHYSVSVETHQQKRYKADSNRTYRQDPLLEYLFVAHRPIEL